MKRDDALAKCPRCGHDHDEFEFEKSLGKTKPAWIFGEGEPKISIHRRCESCGGTWEVELNLGARAKIVIQG
jgi:hypothetical protein